jgi:hypothetical protein
MRDALIASWPARSASGAGNLERFLELEQLPPSVQPAASPDPAANAAAATAEPAG